MKIAYLNFLRTDTIIDVPATLKKLIGNSY